jgi:hypothetical protein
MRKKERKSWPAAPRTPQIAGRNSKEEENRHTTKQKSRELKKSRTQSKKERQRQRGALGEHKKREQQTHKKTKPYVDVVRVDVI